MTRMALDRSMPGRVARGGRERSETCYSYLFSWCCETWVCQRDQIWRRAWRFAATRSSVRGARRDSRGGELTSRNGFSAVLTVLSVTKVGPRWRYLTIRPTVVTNHNPQPSAPRN